MRKAEAAENSVKINGGSNKTQFLCQILNYYFLFKGNVPASSETQGQIVGARESLNRRENMAQEKSKER